MAASTKIITDTATVAATAPTTLTAAKANTAPDLDYIGMIAAALQALAQARATFKALAAATDAGDPNATTLANILLTLT